MYNIVNINNKSSKKGYLLNIEILIQKLIDFYNIKTITELAAILKTTQSTISGWKSREAIGALVEKVNEVNPEALLYLFAKDTQVNHISNSSASSGGSIIDNAQVKTINDCLNHNSIVPKYLTDDLNNLFYRVNHDKEKEEELIEAFDNFIHEQKKKLR